MALLIDVDAPRIVHSHISKQLMEGELFIKQHAFDYILSGTSTVSFGGRTVTFRGGDLRFAVRNRLSRFTKTPPRDGTYRSVSICVDQDTLIEFAREYGYPSADHGSQRFDNVFGIRPNPGFKGYLGSLLPYLEKGDQMDPNLVKLKTKEAVLIFLGSNPELKEVLFDFSEPGKIDLEAYMNQHYAYNGELRDFAYLTGRSLSTFRRDFKKIYGTTPNKWLLDKRLEDSYRLLQREKMKATEVFLETGFKDYSHFSTRFKEKYGVSPSLIGL